MRLARVLCTDIKISMRSACIYLLIFSVAVALCVVSFWIEVYARGFSCEQFSFGDTFLNTLCGMPPIESFERIMQNRLPTAWILLILLYLYAPISILRKDAYGFNALTLLLSGNKTRWWISKCIWTVLFTLLLFLMMILVMACMVFLVGGSLDTCISGTTLQILKIQDPTAFWETADVSLFVMSCTCVVVSLSIVGLGLSFVLRPAISYVAMIAFVIASLFVYHMVFIGNFLMSTRSSLLSLRGIDPLVGIMMSLLFLGASVLFGRFFICRFGLKEDELNL